MRHTLSVVAVGLVWLLATGCSGSKGPEGSVGPVGPSGPTGPSGAQGIQGSSGPTGPSVTLQTLSFGDANCPTGGVKITAGTDLSYVCNGAQGPSVEVPAGSILAFAGDSPPTGWLLCDGSAVSRTQYSTLFSAIAVHWGAGDFVTTFNVPDLRGRFLRGQDHGAGRDPGAAARVASAVGGGVGDSVGSLQADSAGPHTHPVTDPGHKHSAVAGVFVLGSIAGTGLGLGNGGGPFTFSTPQYSADTTTNTTGIGVDANLGVESRPVNAAVNYIIKY